VSGGHWDYRHSSAASQYEGGVGVYFIDEVVDEVKADLENPASEIGDFTTDNRVIVYNAVFYLESVKPEIKTLCDQLVALVGHESKVYEVIDALDRLYSGDIGVETLVYRVNKALEAAQP